MKYILFPSSRQNRQNVAVPSSIKRIISHNGDVSIGGSHIYFWPEVSPERHSGILLPNVTLAVSAAAIFQSFFCTFSGRFSKMKTWGVFLKVLLYCKILSLGFLVRNFLFYEIKKIKWLVDTCPPSSFHTQHHNTCCVQNAETEPPVGRRWTTWYYHNILLWSDVIAICLVWQCILHFASLRRNDEVGRTLQLDFFFIKSGCKFGVCIWKVY